MLHICTSYMFRCNTYVCMNTQWYTYIIVYDVFVCNTYVCMKFLIPSRAPLCASQHASTTITWSSVPPIVLSAASSIHALGNWLDSSRSALEARLWPCCKILTAFSWRVSANRSLRHIGLAIVQWWSRTWPFSAWMASVAAATLCIRTTDAEVP